jgi:flagellar motility protein MotE (MotC chaperone)
MNQYEMIVLIVLIVIIGRVLSNRFGGSQLSRRDQRRVELAKALQPQLPDSVSADEADRMKAEIKRLNERLAVLERIAVDPAKRLSDEIDRLKHD